MFKQYFRPFYLICNTFGVSKPNITTDGKSIPANLLMKIWCFVHVLLYIFSYYFSITITEFKLQDNLELLSDINDLVVNIVIILVNLFKSGKVCINIHKTFNIIFKDLNFESHILKLFATKLYIWFTIPTVLFVTMIFMEIASKYPPYDLLIRIPKFLSMMHLFINLYIILALLKIVNNKLSNTLSPNDNIPYSEELGTKSNIKYILNPAIKFVTFNEHVRFEIKLLCKIYDNLSNCIHLLEQMHGLEILLSIWMMFTSGVVGMTLIVCDKATIIWLVSVKTILPFFWAFIGCLIDEQIRTEVDQTLTLIMKCLIDYRCVPIMQPALKTFKQLVSNDRLQFTACSLFHLSYAMLLGTLINVITYSIILIQMFLN